MAPFPNYHKSIAQPLLTHCWLHCQSQIIVDNYANINIIIIVDITSEFLLTDYWQQCQSELIVSISTSKHWKHCKNYLQYCSPIVDNDAKVNSSDGGKSPQVSSAFATLLQWPDSDYCCHQHHHHHNNQHQLQHHHHHHRRLILIGHRETEDMMMMMNLMIITKYISPLKYGRPTREISSRVNCFQQITCCLLSSQNLEFIHSNIWTFEYLNIYLNIKTWIIHNLPIEFKIEKVNCFQQITCCLLSS